jgi:hypothetical protein
MLSRANRCVLFGTSARSPKAGGPEVRVWSARVKLKLKVLRLRRSESEYCQTKLRTNIKHVKMRIASGNSAYRRGDLFEKRRSLMNSWAKFLCV